MKNNFTISVVIVLLIISFSCNNNEQNAKNIIADNLLDSVKVKPVEEFYINFATIQIENDKMLFYPHSFGKYSPKKEQRNQEWIKVVEKLMPDSLKLQTEENPKGIPERKLENKFGDWGPIDEYFYSTNYIDTNYLNSNYYLICDSGIYSLKTTGTECNIWYNLKIKDNGKFKCESTRYNGWIIIEQDEPIFQNLSDDKKISGCYSAFVFETPKSNDILDIKYSSINKIFLDSSGTANNLNVSCRNDSIYSYKLDNRYCILNNYFVFKIEQNNTDYIYVKLTDCDLPCECWFYIFQIKDNELIKIIDHADQCDI